MSITLINSFQARLAAIKQIQAINIDGGMEIEIRKHKHNRSLAQNRLYWLWIGVIERETGNDQEALHDCLRSKFLGSRLVDVLGNKRTVLPTTTKLSTDGFRTYLTQIEAFSAQELGITLPHPDDIYHQAMERLEK